MTDPATLTRSRAWPHPEPHPRAIELLRRTVVEASIATRIRLASPEARPDSTLRLCAGVGGIECDVVVAPRYRRCRRCYARHRDLQRQPNPKREATP